MYNNDTDIAYSSDMNDVMTGFFGLSLMFNLIEIVAFYCYKVTGTNIELDQKQTAPQTSH